MHTKGTDSAQPLVLESDSYRALTDALQLALATRPILTLVVLAAEVSDGASEEARHTVKASVDDVEQLLLACLRRSDKVVRCGEASCAAILFDAEVDGALRALHRFQRMLGCWRSLAVTLRVGVAAAPEQAKESQELLALALQPRLRILSAPNAEQEALPRMDEAVLNKPALPLPAPRSNGSSEKESKASQQLRHLLAMSTAAALSSEQKPRVMSEVGSGVPAETLARARARALGVPYIAPPHRIPSSVRNLLSVEMMRQLHCLPIGRDRNALTVALADPTDRSVVQRLEQITGLSIFPVMTDLDALEALAQPTRSRRASQMAFAPTRTSK